MSNGMFGNCRHDIPQARELLIALGHESASFLPDDIIINWMNNYLDRLDKLDPDKYFDKKILDVLVDYMILVQSNDETESDNR